MDENSENALRAWRISLGWNQMLLARKARCSQMTISRAERGEPIKRQIINRFVKLGAGALSLADFKEQRPRRKNSNGKES